ncbi:MAG: Fpg/Nei family DNA glycosylase [bacterium]
MPELPDLIYIEKRLQSILLGKSITEVMVKQPIVLRVLVTGPFETSLCNRMFESIYRRGPFLGFQLDRDLELVIHPMLAGRLKLTSGSGKAGRGLCFSLILNDDLCLHYLDDKKMGKVYLIKQGDYAPIPRYVQQGVDILSDEFTLTRFQELIVKQRKQVRVFVMDQTVLSAIGNAYADEILFKAHLHPKTFCYQLSPGDVERLYESIKGVMRWGVKQVEKAQQPIEIKVRDHMKVRNRKDQPCPRCGSTIRRAGVLGFDTFFCPRCQPAVRKQFIEWS